MLKLAKNIKVIFMIKNIVFDFGQVMISFDPTYMTKKYISDSRDIELVASVVFDRLYWNPLDSGDISDEEVVRLSKERLPQRLHKAVEKVYYNWIYNIPEIEGMRELVLYIKEKYRIPVYLLSNISEYFAKNSDKIPVISIFDGCILSAEHKLVKPSRQIFALLCEKFNLTPEETLFIDDSPINISGAESAGLCGYLFDGNVAKLKEYIDVNLFK